MTSTTVDTSVLVAALSTWHPEHATARRALRAAGSLPAHVLVEAYSVLTRLPPPHRIDPRVAGAALVSLDHEVLGLSPAGTRALVATLAAAQVAGGATYDAVVAATALEHGRVLVTLDRRAARTYDVVGASVASPD